MKQEHVYAAQIVFVSAIALGFKTVRGDHDFTKLIASIARYVVYLLFIRGSEQACQLLHKAFNKRKVNYFKIAVKNKLYAGLFAASLFYLAYVQERVFTVEFLIIFAAHLVTKYPDVEHNKYQINYGTGMACSFFEGYLAHVLPSDGAQFVGFEDNIAAYEAQHGIVFPVKRLFVVVTESLYGPPDMKHFNKPNRPDLPYLEACPSLEDVEKDVAGVKKRSYRNSAYKIMRRGAPPVYLSVECATPLHTLSRVLQNRTLYDMLANVDVEQIKSDFTSMLRCVVDKNPQTRGRCQLVYFDDTDPKQNLADVLLASIGQLASNFEEVIRTHREENPVRKLH